MGPGDQLLARGLVRLGDAFRADPAGLRGGFRRKAAQPWRTAGIHLVAALLFSLLYVMLRALVGQVHSSLIDEPVTFLEVFRPLLVKTFPFNLLIYGVIISVSHAIEYYRKYHERTVHALELEKHLTEARLQALLRQLKPHFLFNTLNGIASLMHSDVDAADKMLVRLGELLRLTMSHPGQPLTRLREEIAFIEKYLEIERIRFRDRLSVALDVDPAVAGRRCAEPDPPAAGGKCHPPRHRAARPARASGDHVRRATPISS